MGKSCIIESCPSGRKSGNKASRPLLSYFKPTITRLENWEKSLGIALRPTDNVCHLHFNAEHVKVCETLSVNGKLVIIPLAKKLLKDEALPTIQHQYIQEDDLENTVIHLQRMPESHQNASKKKWSTVAQKNNCKRQKISDPLHLDSTDEECQPAQQNNCKQQRISDPSDVDSTNGECHPAQQNEGKQQETLQTFIDNIKKSSILPQCWLYLENQNRLEFMKFDQESKRIKHHIRVNEDLSITVIFPNSQELLQKKKINNFLNIYDFLKSMERWPMYCVGTQIDDKKYSRHCKGIIVGDDAYKRNRLNPKCRPCRRLRNNLLKRNLTSTSATAITAKRRRASRLEKQYKNTTMWDVKACRGCLTVKGKLEKVGNAFKRVYSAMTDLTIVDGDGYPNYFCLECRTQIKKCMAFRRKSRRAHFVLKEIMSVRKQVTYSDIITVNRKKTNLESSLNFWDPQKSGYVALNENCDVESSTKSKKDTNNHTRILDIKPEIIEDVTEVKEDLPEEPVTLDVADLQDMVTDTDFNDLPEEPIPEEPIPEEPIPEDLDLNDIFKDLNDDKSDTETVVKKKKKPVKVELDILDRMVKSHSIRAILDALEICTIKVLDLEGQRDGFAVRKETPTFAFALYKCSMCLTTHSDMPRLVKHVQFHNSRRDGHECHVCKNKFLTVEDLNKHIAQWHMYQYSCNKCSNVAYCLFDVVKHNKDSHGVSERLLIERRKAIAAALQTFSLSPLPKKVLDKIKALRVEDNEQSDEKDKFKCNICDMSFSQMRYLEGHTTLRHKYMYTCNECQEIFTDRKAAIDHAAVHKTKPTTTSSFTCEQCKEKFNSKIRLRLHRCAALKALIPCNICGSGFRSVRGHYKHQILKHKYLSLNDPLVGDPQYKCADCGVQFVEKKGYERHVVTTNHAGADDVEFACIPCKKVFEDDEQMETHFITCGRNKKYPRKCCYCEEVLTDHVQYKQHYLYKHPTLQYRYTKMNSICELCGRLVQKYQLEAHLKTHSVAAFECRHCGLASPTATAHVLHVLAAHAARPYCCSLCARRFQHRADCKDHILKVHSPTKLYKCEFCGDEFSYFKHLRDHSETQHNLIIPIMKGNPKKSKSKVFVYAHMYIEINELEREAVANTEVAMLDYLDQKSKPVASKDFFRLKANPDEYIVRIHKKLRKIKKPRNKKIGSEVIKPSELEEAVSQIKNEVKEEPVMEIEIKVKDEAVSEIQKEESIGDVPMEVEPDEGNPLEVFENDGGQYVMIGGELYRIAGDGEEEE